MPTTGIYGFAMKRKLKLNVYSPLCALICGAWAIEAGAQPTPERCDTWTRTLSKDDEKYTVWLMEEGCSGFSNGETVTLALSQGDGTKTAFFKFGDASWNADFYGQTTPSAKWISRDHLVISIGAVADILKKLSRVDGVIITYRIGHVVYP